MKRMKPAEDAEHTPVAEALRKATSPSIVVFDACPHYEELARIQKTHLDVEWTLYDHDILVRSNLDKLHSAQREIARIVSRTDSDDSVAVAQSIYEHLHPKKASIGERARRAFRTGFAAGSSWVDSLHFNPRLRHKTVSTIAGFLFSKLMSKEDAELEATDFASFLEEELRLARRRSSFRRLIAYAYIWLTLPHKAVTGIIEHRRMRLTSQNGREQ